MNRIFAIALSVMMLLGSTAHARGFYIGYRHPLGASTQKNSKKKNTFTEKLIVLGLGYGIFWYTLGIFEKSDGEKLFDKEERQLYSFLGAVSLVTGKNAMRRDGSGNSVNRRPPVVSGQVIESRIDGEFEGWDGETIFVLQNGQIWQQAVYSYTYSYKYNPRVWLVEAGLHWTMKVEGMSQTVSVKRVR